MNRKKYAWCIFGGIDLVLFGIAAVLVGVGAMLARFHPVWWGYYFMMLDVRVWPPWKCVGLGVIVAESLLIIRCWPNKRQTSISGTGEDTK